MNKYINLDELVDMMQEDGKCHCYCNVKTLELLMVDEVYLNVASAMVGEEGLGYYQDWEQEEIVQARRFLLEEVDYLKIPDQSQINSYQMMKDFCLSLEDRLRDIFLYEIQRKGAYRRFRSQLEYHNKTDQWSLFKVERLLVIAKQWCVEHHLPYEKEEIKEIDISSDVEHAGFTDETPDQPEVVVCVVEEDVVSGVIELKKEQYKGYELVFSYEARQYYEVNYQSSPSSFEIVLSLQSFGEILQKEFKETLFQSYWEHASAFGLFVKDQLVAVIELDREEWSKRLRITNVVVLAPYRRKGYAKILMTHVIELAKREHHRAIILETQSCNVPAIRFYQAQGFVLSGMDFCCYSNQDIQKKEVRLEFAYYI